jgi:hypothetical protein
MPRKKTAVDAEVVSTGEAVVVWKAKRPLTTTEHEQLSHKLRFEEEQSGVKIVLMPHVCDVGGGEQ